MSWSDARGTFAIVGAQKCGTTALSAFLGSHPDICVAEPAETHFFDRSRYFGDGKPPYGKFHQTVFRHYDGEPAVGWSTPSIMFVRAAAERLVRYNPELKVIALLRHPVERAFSHYRMQAANGLEPLGFRAALEKESARLPAGLDFGQPGLLFSYVARGLYGPQITRLLDVFGPSQVLFIDSARLAAQHHATLAAVYDFLRVPRPPAFPEKERFHVGPAAQMTAAERTSLLRLYERTVDEVQDILGWTLPEWRQ
jgi:hypothetical protein